MKKYTLIILLFAQALLGGCMLCTQKYASTIEHNETATIEAKWKSNSGAIAVSGYFNNDPIREPVYFIFSREGKRELRDWPCMLNSSDVQRFGCFLPLILEDRKNFCISRELSSDYFKDYDLNCSVGIDVGKNEFRGYNAIWTVPVDLVVVPIAFIIMGIGFIFHPYAG